jgi:hypothetical protein
MTHNLVRFVFAPRYGLFSIRLRSRFFKLKAPWCLPLFSERAGLEKRIRLFFGWRVLVIPIRGDHLTNTEGK